MATDKAVFVGPRLRRLRRDLGLTQTAMAEDLEISPSYIALIERNQRPLTAKVLLKLASIYKVNLDQFVGDGGTNLTKRIKDVLKDPLYAELDLGPSEPDELAEGYPGLAEALVRAHKAYQDAQLALADWRKRGPAYDTLEEARAFLSSQHNYFDGIDRKAEKIGLEHVGPDALAGYLEAECGYRTRRMPSEVMGGVIRRLDPHTKQMMLDRSLTAAAASFQFALQITYLSFNDEIDAAMNVRPEWSDDGRQIARRALANYAAGAILMPYSTFFGAAEEHKYDIEVLMNGFDVSFEQVAHRLSTLQRPEATGVPFFFIRADAAGNVSKRYAGEDIPFARHGGSCPLWNVHAAFKSPQRILTQIAELPDGARFFSIARTVIAGGGAHLAPRAERAVALGCAIEHAHRLVYTQDIDLATAPATPIGVTCTLCHRTDCLSRAAPPLGRRLLPDDHRRTAAPFVFGDEG